MESLYTKYRPQTFADVVGQRHVVSTLERAVLEGRTSHAYLFCGPRGTGKTTMARLLAKALMCEQGEGHLPDGSCEQCRMIAAGEHPDVYELDAASRTGVDNVREEIISRVSFAPVRAPYKMYIIDEVHMLTTAAFNALLKTLEEPPSHVVFVLCTTDPQKIPETILSRVQRFDFHSIGNDDIQARLAYICEREGFSYDPEALGLVVRHARGGMRDAISELEQLSVSGGGSITVDVARDVLGEVSASTLERMSMAMATRDVPVLFAELESLVEVGRDLLQFTRALAARLRDVYVVTAIGARSGSVGASDDELPALAREAQAFGSVDRVARALELLSDASTEMRVAPNQRLVLEVALTKIARPQSELTLEALADRVASLERQIVALSTPIARSGGTEAATGRPAGGREAAARPAQAVDAAPRSSEPATAAQRTAQPDSQPSGQAQATQPRQDAAPRQGDGQARSAAPAQIAQQQAPAAQQPQAPVAQQQAPAAQQPQAPVVQQQAPAAASAASQQTPPAPQQTPPASSPAPQAVAPQAAQPAAQAPAPVTTVMDPGELQRRWREVVDGLLSSHPQHGSLLLNSTAVSDDGQTLTISLPKGSGFAFKMLERADVRANVDPVIERVFGRRKTRFANGPVAGAAPAGGTAAARPQTQAAPAQRQAATTQRAAQSAPPRQAPQNTAPQTGAPATASQPPAAQVPATQAPAQQRQAPNAPVTRVAQPQATQPQTPQNAQRPQAPQAAQPPQATQAPQAQTPQQTWDDDMVPYDDFDASPYEEDYLFGSPESVSAPTPGFARQASAGAPGTGYAGGRGAQFASAQVGAGASQAPATQAPTPGTQAQAAATQAPAQGPQASVDAPPTQTTYAAPWEAPAPATTSQEVARQDGAAQPATEQAVAPNVPPREEPATAPATTSEPELTPATSTSDDSASAASDPEAQQPDPEAAPQADAAQTPASKPAAKRARRAGGIPADIIAMMTEIFGEGITYSSEPPEDEPEEGTVAQDAGDFEAAPGEGEFADEPVDDADFDEDDE